MNKYLLKIVLIIALLIEYCLGAKAQYTYGTTGLLNMPTADMQQDKTVMIGGGYLDKHTSVARWYYNTFNYYVNVTFFPWLEVSYNLTLVKALPDDHEKYPKKYWVPRTYGKFVNQDRAFSARLRIWKEGWFREWTPQIVIGMDDILSASWAGMSLSSSKGNGFSNRFYISASKHINIEGAADIGAHVTYMYNNDRWHYSLNGIGIGANLRFNFKEDNKIKKVTWQKLINGLNLMVEAYPADGKGVWWIEQKGVDHYDRGLAIGKYDINVGCCYSVWKDYINFYGELYGCKDFSGGIQFKLHLK